MIRILFVCLGNICRSPLAEAIFRQKVANSGLSDKSLVDSAGTGNYHVGEDPDERTIEIAQDNAIPITHKARQFTRQDFASFDYILAMDNDNLRNIQGLIRGEIKTRIFLMLEFDKTDLMDVPDPYFGGKDGFEKVFSILDSSLDHFLDFLKKEHQF